MWLLKFFSIKDLRYVLLIFLLAALGYLYHKNKFLKEENKRTTENYNNALKIDSLQVAVFKVRKQHEIEELLNQNTELNKLVTSSNIKRKRIQSLYYQQQKFVDSIKKKKDVSGLVEKIRKDIPSVIQWKDSTECLTIKGNVAYRNDSLSVNVKERSFNNETVLIQHKGRRKRVKWLFGLRLGPRESKFTPETKCGNSKVTIIKKEK